MNAVTSLTSLSSRRRLRLAWTLTWPAVVFDLASWAAPGGPSVNRPDQQSPAYIIFQFIFFLVVAPWIIRRAVRADYPAFHLVRKSRNGGPDSRVISYSESLSVAWLLFWRTAAVGLTVSATFACLVWIVLGIPPDFSTLPVASGALGLAHLVGGHLLSLAVFYLWLVSSAIQKKYAKFALRVCETA